MANLRTLSFKQLVDNWVAAAQATASAILDFAPGSTLLSLAQATAGLMLWFQGVAVTVLGVTRASTSRGVDLDTWMDDFNFHRLPGVAAIGQEVFARSILGTQILVPVGAQVQTADGSHVYTVIADTTNVNYDVALNGYVILPGSFSVSATVQAVEASALSNVAAETIVQQVTGIPGVEGVTNPLAFTNGVDPETDSAFRTRFVAFLGSLSRATRDAITYGIMQVASVTQPVYFSLTENQNPNGSAHLGYFYAYVDDGTGNPSQDFLNEISDAIELYRGFTIQYAVFPATSVVVAFQATLTTAQGYNHSSVTGQVTAAITTAINTLNLGQTLSYTNLIKLCYDTVPGAVTNVVNPLLNNSTSDVICTSKQVIRAGAINIS